MAVVVAAVVVAWSSGFLRERADLSDAGDGGALPTPNGGRPTTSDVDQPPGSDGGDDRVAYYDTVVDALPDQEAFTVLVVAGATREEVAQALGVDLAAPVDVDDVWDDDETTGWASIDIAGGVLAVEPTGYGDPALDTLRALSAEGRAAAVLRTNIQAHERFGAARDGELLFDDDEFMYVEDPSIVPAEIRPLFDLVWDDLESDGPIDLDGPNPTAVALAMSEVVTGVVVRGDDLAEVGEAQHFKAPSLVYGQSLED
ncbi:DUF6461 domain-containing protein [Nocardioides sp. L-11A]|uniref:DUF6461 domain-containing protein n=1 Tax=Nocardioides sp. L-11A TaxID=3043848 RepID=UPI00249A2C5E|nr:DUF6461 domain-containing protein [Nocardioides sp. L-11A]